MHSVSKAAVRCGTLAVLIASTLPPVLLGQEPVRQPLQLAMAGPRFLSTPAPGAPPVDVRDAPALQRHVTLEFDQISLQAALDQIQQQTGLHVFASWPFVPVDKRVSLHADGISVGAALFDLLLGTGLDVQLAPDGGSLSLVPRVGATTHAARRQQTGTVAGRVLEVKTGRPLAGATVVAEGTSARASTRKDGDYTLGSLPVGAYNITARILGHTPLTKKVQVGPDSTTHVDFALDVVAASLDEVVTTVTGNQRKLELGNAIATIAADSVVATAPITSFSDVIAGRAPGVQVYFNGGLTGASPEITIRGQNSAVLSNQPLLVVDGVRVENSPAKIPSNAAITDEVGAGRFNDLNPEDIESVEIVKGPAAATLYGTDAANGVILVKTKQGHTGRQTWQAYAEGGLLTLDRSRLWNAYHAFGHTTDGTNTPTQCFNLARVAGQCVLDSLTNFDPLKVPGLSIVGTGNRAQYGLQTSGGAGQTRYFATGGYEEETGVLQMPAPDKRMLETLRGGPLGDDELRPNAVQRGNVRANLVTSLAPTADLTLSGALTRQHDRIPSPDVWAAGARGPGYRDANDGWNLNPGRPSQVLAARNSEDVTRATPGSTVEWRPASWLTTRATGGLDFSSNFFDELLRAGEGAIGNQAGIRTNQKTNIALYTADVGASASFDLSPHVTSKTSTGAQYTRRLQQDVVAQGFNLSPGATTVAGAATQIAREATVESIVAGAYAEQTFGLNNRLFLTGAARIDGASAFGTAFKSAVYPKGSASWLISDEPFMPHVPGLNTLRLRAAYGASGVQPGSTASLPFVTLAPALVNGGATTGAIIGALGNPHLGPERQTELEAGLDAELLRSRVQLEATYYRKKSTDALLNVPLAASLGVPGNFGGGGTIQENVGSIQNWGYEGALNLRVLESRALGWDLNFNGSVNHNRVLTLAPGITSAAFGLIRQGYPVFPFFDLPILGYKDANGNGVIEPNEVTVGSTPVFMGQAFPKAQLTAATTVTLLDGRVQVHAQVDHRGGFIVSGEDRSGSIFNGNAQSLNDPKAPLADQAATVAALAYRSFAGFDEDGSFTRFRELSVTYALPVAFVHHLAAARNASVTFAGRNLGLWTKFKGVDPEINRDPGGLAPLTGGPVSYYAYAPDADAPPSQYWILRVRLGW